MSDQKEHTGQPGQPDSEITGYVSVTHVVRPDGTSRTDTVGPVYATVEEATRVRDRDHAIYEVEARYADPSETRWRRGGGIKSCSFAVAEMRIVGPALTVELTDSVAATA